MTSSRSYRWLKDILAGLTVSLATISLGAALGILSGRGAFAGMLGASIIPLICSLFGGTKVQASGPTALMIPVFAIILAFAHDQYIAMGGTDPNQFIAVVMCIYTVIMSLFALFRVGKLVSYVPQIVILGFMNGIALSIRYDQLSTLSKTNNYIAWTIAIATFCIIIILPYLYKKLRIPTHIASLLPNILIVIIIMTIIDTLLQLNVPHVQLGANINSLNDFMTYVYQFLPQWSSFTRATILMAFPFALKLSILSYLDSLLTSVIIDKMTGLTSHRNRELFVQGLSNTFTTLVGGVPGAQSTAVSVLLINEGATTRLGGIMVGVFGLIRVALFSGYIELVASATFAGVLIKAGRDIFDSKYFIDFVKNKRYIHKNTILQFLLIITASLVTFFIDLNWAVIGCTIIFVILKSMNIMTDIDSSEVTNIETEN